MKKAKINIQTTKKGYDVILALEDGKSIKAVNFGIPKDEDGKECSVEMEKGQPVKVTIEGTTYTKSGKRGKVETRMHRDARSGKSRQLSTHNDRAPSAPYNFVPLNSRVVPFNGPPSFNKFHEDRRSGYIEIDVTTKTPLYIRDTSGKSVFFSPGDIVKIPGSSIRGMTRTLVEIASWGKFRFFEDKRLYYRGLADVSSLRCEYNNKIINVKAGYLNYDSNRKTYYIQPAKEKNGETHSQIEDNREFKIEPQKDGTYILCTGKMQGKKKNWLINQPDKDAQRVSLSDEDMNDYRKDSNRNIKWDLLNMAKNKKQYTDGVPCFFTEYTTAKGKKKIAFGHTRYFRLPYELTIGEHVPGNLQQDDTVDLPEALFGKESKWATRVFFEDAEIEPGQDNIFPEETSPKILSSPKPTTFQHYLTQPGGVASNSLKHWNDGDAAIRGYKSYWHRDAPDSGEYSWSEGKIITDDVHTIIKPVKQGVRFKGRIRFENLSDVELGALLFVLNLPENCFHKLGMGKPLGLGSVEIKPTLWLIGRKQRYESLFNKDKGWNTAEEQETDITRFISAFETFVLSNIPDADKGNASNLRDTPRMKALKTMLDWNNTQKQNWLERTRYKEIQHTENRNEFRNRPELPLTEKIIK